MSVNIYISYTVFEGLGNKLFTSIVVIIIHFIKESIVISEIKTLNRV